MRKAVILAALLLSGCAHRQEAIPVDLSPAINSIEKASISLSKATKCNDKKQINESLVEAQKDLNQAKGNIYTQQALAQKLSESRDWWKNHSSEQDSEIQALKTKLSHFNHLLFLSSSLAGIMVGLVVGRFAMAFSPYGVLVGIGAGIAASGATWAILAHL